MKFMSQLSWLSESELALLALNYTQMMKVSGVGYYQTANQCDELLINR